MTVLWMNAWKDEWRDEGICELITLTYACFSLRTFSFRTMLHVGHLFGVCIQRCWPDLFFYSRKDPGFWKTSGKKCSSFGKMGSLQSPFQFPLSFSPSINLLSPRVPPFLVSVAIKSHDTGNSCKPAESYTERIRASADPYMPGNVSN